MSVSGSPRIHRVSCLWGRCRLDLGKDSLFDCKAPHSPQPVFLHLLHLLGCRYNASGICMTRSVNSVCPSLQTQRAHFQQARNQARGRSLQSHSEAQVDSLVNNQRKRRRHKCLKWPVNKTSAVLCWKIFVFEIAQSLWHDIMLYLKKSDRYTHETCLFLLALSLPNFSWFGHAFHVMLHGDTLSTFKVVFLLIFFQRRHRIGCLCNNYNWVNNAARIFWLVSLERG